ncbi:MAG: metal-dependent hydrolase [Pirellulales bacterium]|nr:metal-dependent hydrolase [Pirellulales bacterium]
MTKLTWLSHGSWLIETGDHRILLDPFLEENPAATASPDDLDRIDYLLISHGHFDHVADAASIAKRCGATLVASYEIAQWFGKQHGIESALGMNLGGTAKLPFGQVKMLPALHSNSLPDGTYGGDPAGFLLTIDGQRIYFACDTALFSDMRLHAHQVDVAVLPIGDLFTMGVEDSITATKMIEPRTVLPAHYNTWPPIAQDAEDWRRRVEAETKSQAVVLAVGESFRLPNRD